MLLLFHLATCSMLFCCLICESYALMILTTKNQVVMYLINRFQKYNVLKLFVIVKNIRGQSGGSSDSVISYNFWFKAIPSYNFRTRNYELYVANVFFLPLVWVTTRLKRLKRIAVTEIQIYLPNFMIYQLLQTDHVPSLNQKAFLQRRGTQSFHLF